MKNKQVPELTVKVLFKPDKVGETAGGNCTGFFVCGGV